MTTFNKKNLKSNVLETLFNIKVYNFCNWKLINSELKNCKLYKFTVKKIKFNDFLLNGSLKTNLNKFDNNSLKSKLFHTQIINEVFLDIKNIGFKKHVCLSLTSSDISNSIKNKILYPDSRLRNGNQFVNESQTMVIEQGILNEYNTETNLKCLDIINLIEKENSQNIIEDSVDKTVVMYKDYIINHVFNCHHKICYECFNISKSPEGKFLIEVFKTNFFTY